MATPLHAAAALGLVDLPFERQEPLALLGIDRARREPDLSGDFAGCGHATLDEIVLADAEGRRTIVRDVLVVALHTPELDDPDADPDAFELEFQLSAGDATAPPVAVFVPLSRFLDVRVAAIVGSARTVVLALCNPRGLRPAAPRWLDPSRRLLWATGDVVSWLDVEADGRERFRLQAERWYTLVG